jgi:phosphopantetheine--protein transferase-like protein
MNMEDIKKSYPTKLDLKSIPTDLSNTPVIVGFGEIGTYGSANVRWCIEKDEYLSVESTVELAWIMGYIKYDKSKGDWIDLKSGEIVSESKVVEKYTDDLLRHSGIRLIDPNMMCDKTNPDKVERFVEYELQNDLGPISALDDEDIFNFTNHDSNKLIRKDNKLFLQKGSKIKLKKAIINQSFVAAQIPSGWDPKTFGLSDSIIRQVDRTALFTLISLSEAMISSGIEDVREFYQEIDSSNIGITIGTGLGGAESLEKSYIKIKEEVSVQTDILQETLSNVIAAWTNMLMLNASGPIITPVQACAAAAASLHLGEEMIRNRRAKVVIVGGTDDYGEMGLIQFRKMGATSNSTKELKNHRPPREHSRPTTSSRNGFVESHGSSIQIVTTADLALKMGLPIYGIVGHTTTACDGFGKSVPAPGKGILKAFESQKLVSDVATRIQNSIIETNDIFKNSTKNNISSNLENIIFKSILDNAVPNRLQNALIQHGLTGQDIDAISFHGTSTKGNDKNESEINNSILNLFQKIESVHYQPVPVVCQKYLTGHGKGPSFGYMLNGCLQMMRDNIIPGNRNADNIDSEFEAFENLIYPDMNHKKYIKSVLLHSFGFGQANCQVLIINPNFLFQKLSCEQYKKYQSKIRTREHKHFRLYQNVLSGIIPYVRIPDSTSPVSDTRTRILDKEPDLSLNSLETKLKVKSNHSVGVDSQRISNLPLDNRIFIERNFTKLEQEYCESNLSLRKHRYAGRWAAKEALVKAFYSSFDSSEKHHLQNPSKELIEIEILSSKSGQPVVDLHGSFKKLYQRIGFKELNISISHDGDNAFSVVTLIR